MGWSTKEWHERLFSRERELLSVSHEGHQAGARLGTLGV
jgi:hypothetical protein